MESMKINKKSTHTQKSLFIVPHRESYFGFRYISIIYLFDFEMLKVFSGEMRQYWFKQYKSIKPYTESIAKAEMPSKNFGML